MGERGVAVVIEDDGDIRAALAEVLRQAGFAVYSAPSAAEGLGSVREHNPDIVTIDIGLPDFDGLEVSRRIRTFSDAFVIIVSGRADEVDALMGFEAGADDYLTKPFRPRELRARIKAMLRRPRSTSQGSGGYPPDPAPAGTGDAGAKPAMPTDSFDFAHKGLTLHESTRQVEIDGVPVTLTRSQFEILVALMENGRAVQSKADLARRLRSEPYNTGSIVSADEERAIEVHLSNLRKRLGENSKRPRWVETVHGIGYRMAP